MLAHEEKESISNTFCHTKREYSFSVRPIGCTPAFVFLQNEDICILNYCSEAEVYGIICFGMGLTLREGSREYFFRQLDHLFPGMKEKYLQTYGMQYQIVSNKNDELMQLFHHTCEKNGIVHDNRKIFEYLSTFETKCDNVQLSLFDKDFAGKSPNGI